MASSKRPRLPDFPKVKRPDPKQGQLFRADKLSPAYDAYLKERRRLWGDDKLSKEQFHAEEEPRDA